LEASKVFGDRQPFFHSIIHHSEDANRRKITTTQQDLAE
jgi:hypothetical protein